MKKINSLIHCSSVIYLVIIIFLYWLDTSVLFNPVAIMFFVLLCLYLIFKNKYIGITFSSLMIFMNIYLIFALLSEYQEFENYKEGLPMLIIGLSLIITNILAAVLITKFATNNTTLIKQL